MKNTLFLLFLIAGYSARPQDFDCKPRTCTIKEAGQYHIELAGCRNTLDIYVYNAEVQPVRLRHLGGYVDFYYNDQTVVRAPFEQYYYTNGLSAKILGPDFSYCKITLTVGWDIISVTFANECDLRAETLKTPKLTGL